jgi:hypothetical protein
LIDVPPDADSYKPKQLFNWIPLLFCSDERVLLQRLPTGIFWVVDMRSSRRIVAAVWVLIALAPSAFTQPSVICVESSGRISYGCNDVVPDETRMNLAVPVQFGFSSEDCGFCHDYTVDQTLTQLFAHSAPTLPVTPAHEIVLRQYHSPVLAALLPVPVIDSSGGISPLKC